MAGDRTNPSVVGGDNEYAGFVAPKRADKSTIGPGGNTVDRGVINKTLTEVGSPTQAKPFGPSSGSGY